MCAPVPACSEYIFFCLDPCFDEVGIFHPNSFESETLAEIKGCVPLKEKRTMVQSPKDARTCRSVRVKIRRAIQVKQIGDHILSLLATTPSVKINRSQQLQVINCAFKPIDLLSIRRLRRF
jgi:hypothetical protein